MGILFLFSYCESQSEFDPTPEPSNQLVDSLKSQVKYGLQLYMEDDTLRMPRSSDGTEIAYASKVLEWTNGFYPGILWQMYEISKDTVFKEAARDFTWTLKPLEDVSSTHDLGFMINNSFGKAYEITEEEKYLEVLIRGAENLSSRYNQNVECIKSWDWGKSKNGWSFPVIIDNMMNLELLFKASELTGNTTYHNIAVSHAQTTMKNHFRSDYSSFHVVDFDSDNGTVRSKGTHQGLDDNSDWARGQAWGLYGFTMCYRYTSNRSFLDHSEKIASFILEHPNMESDLIPYWDLKDPLIPDTPKDASAAAIMASAFAELYTHTGKEIYKQSATQIVNTLLGSEYLASYGTSHGFLLNHSVGNLPNSKEVDVSIIYTDYYFLEALRRLQYLN